MARSDYLVVFLLDERRFALRLGAVERVVRMAAIDPLPEAPAIVLGVVNIGGRIVPVVDPRPRFGTTPRAISVADHLIVARTAGREVALVVDAVEDVVERAAPEITPALNILPDLPYIEGVAKLDGGLIFIHDLDTFLSLDEAQALDRAMAAGTVVR